MLGDCGKLNQGSGWKNGTENCWSANLECKFLNCFFVYCFVNVCVSSDLLGNRSFLKKRSMQKYRIVGRLGEGTFSEVLKCQSYINGKLYACKKMKKKFDSVAQVDNVREIQALRRLNPHPNIIELKEVIFDRRTNSLALMCEIMDMNVYELIKDRRSFLPEKKVQLYMYQLCKSIYHMHKNGIFHRDVKPENILIKDNQLKLADFGSCKSVFSKQPYTEYISTRWYRAPECLLTDGFYDRRMDLWSVGCVFFEVMTLRPLFPGSNELDQVAKIHAVVGSPATSVLEKFKKNKSRHMDFNFPFKQGSGILALFKHGSRGCVELINKLCTYDPDLRLTAKQALKHPYFRELRYKLLDVMHQHERREWRSQQFAMEAQILAEEGQKSHLILSNIPLSEADRRTVKHTMLSPFLARDLVGTRPPGKTKTKRDQLQPIRFKPSQYSILTDHYGNIKKSHNLSTKVQHPAELAQSSERLLPPIPTKAYPLHQQRITLPSEYTPSSKEDFLPSLPFKDAAKQCSLFTSTKDQLDHRHHHSHDGGLKTKKTLPHLPPITKHRTGAA